MVDKKGSARPTPGDRGDANQKAGIASIKSGYSGNLSGECSKGYDEVKTGWGGNVKR
jgi:hypothetical protein